MKPSPRPSPGTPTRRNSPRTGITCNARPHGWTRMDEPARKPIQDDVRETLVTAARRFMALHPDVTAVGLTIVSPTIRPEALSTVVVGAAGPPVTPEAW